MDDLLFEIESLDFHMCRMKKETFVQCLAKPLDAVIPIPGDCCHTNIKFIHGPVFVLCHSPE
jgi:hypothetical protein